MKVKYVQCSVYGIFMVIFMAIAYRQLPYLYYLNDEWLTYGEVLTYGFTGFLATQPWWVLFLGVGRPLGTVINNIFILVFPFSSVSFAVLAYICHLFNGILVWILIKKITKKWYASMIGGLFFVSLCVYHQAFSWMSNSVQVSCSAFFLLSSIVLFLTKRETRDSRWFYLSWFLAYISFLFKETAVFLLMLLPFLSLIFGNNTSLYGIVRKHFFLIVGGLMVMAYRVSTLPSVTGISTGTVLYWAHVAFNIVYYPIISLSQMFIPRDFMFRIAHRIGEQLYPNVMPFIAAQAPVFENMVTDVISLLLSSFMIFLISQFYIHNVKQRKNIVFAVFFYISSFIPLAAYLFIRGTSYIESRYMYLPAIPISILIGIAAQESIQQISRIKYSFVRVSLLVGFTIVSLLFFLKQSMVVNQEVRKSVSFGNETKQTIEEMKRLYQKLPRNSIVYITGDVSYYGFPYHRVPWQLGPGYITMVMYFRDGLIPASFIQNRFLWQLTSQGYYEENGKSFGFFDDKEKLITFFRNNPALSTDAVIGLYYYGNDKKMVDITREIREELQTKRQYK